ncbi:MAG TPA: ATP-binding protein [Roseimicrobium sp.]|nr:ATP-binding protein [Roseimicrobium sp.]
MNLLSEFPEELNLKEQRLDVGTMVSHHESVDGLAAVESVYTQFQRHSHEYMAVTMEGKVIGAVSRGQIGFLLGSQFGFALYGRQPVARHMMAKHLSVDLGTPLIDVLDRALSREGDAFYDDIVMVDSSGSFKGIVQVRTLVQLQTKLISDITHHIEIQRETLVEQNWAITENLNQLRRSQGRYDILFENTVLGVALLNRRGEVESHNLRFAALLGLEPRINPDHLHNLCDMVVQPEQQAFLFLVGSQEQVALGGGGAAISHSGEFRLQLPRAGQRHFKIIMNWIAATDQICVLIDDISEQRLLERKLAQKEKSNLLESLVGGIAHELNNKLAPIMMFAELVIDDLESGTSVGSVLEHCNGMRRSTTEAARIITQLLQLSKPAKMELAACDYHDIVEDASTILMHRLRQASVTVESGLWKSGHMVIGDVQQIKQVVVNLMLNSLDAMEGSSSRILRFEAVQDGETCTLVITDTGCGIDPKIINRVFDPFFTTKSPDRGTGLGLSVCYNIIKQHGGEISIQSQPGMGTQIRIRLPAAVGLNSREAMVVERPSGAGRPARRAEGQNRVLIVDDEDAVSLMLLSVVKRGMGCHAERVADGELAIKRLQEDSFDLIISDVRMPRVNGLALFRWVREHREDLGTRFFFITGDAGGADLNEEIEALGVPVLRKPFHLDALLTQCQLLLKE